MEENVTRRTKILRFKQKNNTEKNTLKQGVWFLNEQNRWIARNMTPKLKI